MAKGQTQSKFFGHTQWNTNARVLMHDIVWSLATRWNFRFRSLTRVKYRLCTTKHTVATVCDMINTIRGMSNETAKQGYLRLSRSLSHSHGLIDIQHSRVKTFMLPFRFLPLYRLVEAFLEWCLEWNVAPCVLYSGWVYLLDEDVSQTFQNYEESSK